MKAMWNDGPALPALLDDPWAPHPVVNRHICSGGGGGQQTSQQQTSSSNEPPAFIQPYLKGAIGDLSNLYNANPNAPAYYPGSTVAPQSDATQQAISLLQQRGLNGSPVTGAAETNLTDTLNGKYLDPTSNPDYLAAISASHQPYVDQFLGQIIPGITSAFEGSGRTGSGLHQDAVDRATTNLNRTISDADAKAGSDYFTQARNQQLQAAGMAPQLAQSDYTDIGAVGQAGDIKDAFSQANINADIAKYNYNNNAQWDYITRYLGILNGGYPGGVTNSTSTGTQTQPQSSPWGSIFGGASLGLQMLPLLGFSDERLKDIKDRVGETDDGLPLYLYTYKDDPSTPHIGPIAQEVAQVRPDAVHEHPSGYLMVDYGAATEHRGLF
jgi:hypothetical protein